MSAGWRETLSELLMGVAVVGTGAVVLQRLGLAAHMSGLSESGRRLNGAVSTAPRRGISILKPLAGLDDGLAQNLKMFAALSYAPYELLLGVKDTSDAAYPLAQEIARRHPNTKVVVQSGVSGLSPKVSQLISLERAARYDIVLISDSGIRPPIGYLDEMSQLFDDPSVGCVTHMLSGMGHTSWGARFNNMELASVASRVISGKVFLKQGFAMGASQALRRNVLRQLGGFEAYKDFLNDDYVLGRDVQRLGYKVEFGRQPVFNYSSRKGVGEFAMRFSRWTTGQATATGSPLPAIGMGLLNPVPLALGALVLSPTWGVAKTAAIITGIKVVSDMTAAASLGVQPLGLTEALSIPVKDVVSFGAWAHGLVTREVNWRGNKLRVGAETRLIAPAGATLPVDAQQPAQLQETLPTAAPQVERRVAAPAPVPARPHFGPPRRGGQRARLRSSVAGRRTGSR